MDVLLNDYIALSGYLLFLYIQAVKYCIILCLFCVSVTYKKKPKENKFCTINKLLQLFL